ncbi:MAG: threonine aldolase family protein [Candidatus Aphodosoma sp.]
MDKIHFDCDYIAGAHPEIMRRLSETNLLKTPGYGYDDYTRSAEKLILDMCGLKQGRVHFLVGGTQTNATVIDGLLHQYEGVIATEFGHVNVHESGAIEASGHKVLALPAHDGKLNPKELKQYIADFYRDDTWQHMVQPGMVYISHPTELGTLYSLKELEDISMVCHEANIPLYLDGARLGYGLMADDTDVTIQDIARLCDVFYIGGTKVGALFGEAVVVTRDNLLPRFFSLIKQHGALLAKGRLLGLQFETLFTDGLYFKIARHAVEQAMKLKKAFVEKGYRLFIDSPTNQQFVILPNSEIDRLSEYASFEYWGPRGEKETPVRFVTDWSTKADDVDMFIKQL